MKWLAVALICLLSLVFARSQCDHPIEPGPVLVSPDTIMVDQKTNIVQWSKVDNDSLDYYNLYVGTGQSNDSELIAYFRFDKNDKDLTGINTLTWNMKPEYIDSDVDFATSAKGSAVKFYSSNRFNGAAIMDSDPLSGGVGKSITVETWVRINAYDKGREQAIITKFYDSDFKDWGIQVGDDGRLIVGIESNGNDYYVNGKDSIPAGTWTHVAFTFCNTNNKVEIYINGNKDATKSTILDMPNTSAPVCIGWHYYNGESYLNGDLDEIRIWNHARSIQEIQDHLRQNLGYGLPFRVDKRDTSYHFIGLTHRLTYATSISCVGIDGRETKPTPEITWIVQKPKVPIILTWDPNSEADLMGYKVYRGTMSRCYDYRWNVGNVTKFIDSVMVGFTYYWAVTAYDSADNESDYSNEVSLFATEAAILSFSNYGLDDREFEQNKTY